MEIIPDDRLPTRKQEQVMREGICDHPKAEKLMRELAIQFETVARKRKGGDGTIRQKPAGRREARYVIGYGDKGYPKTKNVLAKTKKGCAEKLLKLKEEPGGIKSNKVNPGMRFGDWLEYWYENHAKPKIRPTTQAGYERRSRLHIVPEIDNIPLNKLTQNDLQKFCAQLKKNGRKSLTEHYGEGLSDQMVRMCHTTCRTTLEKTVQNGLIRANPTIDCNLPPKKAREMQVLDRDELQRFLIQAQAKGYYGLFLLPPDCAGVNSWRSNGMTWTSKQA